ncbi:hypothetical protein CL656_00230 [bacterium]|nr:hypothetical protein [bacterium]|tara:strand:+ start:6962 stop:9235 length:2274 start_codon:yes stop_codon:yes gene_type:complete
MPIENYSTVTGTFSQSLEELTGVNESSVKVLRHIMNFYNSVEEDCLRIEGGKLVANDLYIFFNDIQSLIESAYIDELDKAIQEGLLQEQISDVKNLLMQNIGNYLYVNHRLLAAIYRYLEKLNEDIYDYSEFSPFLYALKGELNGLFKELKSINEQIGINLDEIFKNSQYESDILNLKEQVWTEGVSAVIGQTGQWTWEFVEGLKPKMPPKFENVDFLSELIDNLELKPEKFQAYFKSIESYLDEFAPKLDPNQIAIIAEKLSFQDFKLFLSYINDEIKESEFPAVVRHAMALRSPVEEQSYSLKINTLKGIDSISNEAISFLRSKGFYDLSNPKKLKEVLLGVNIEESGFKHDFAKIILLVTEYEATRLSYEKFLEDGVDHIQHPVESFKKAIGVIDRYIKEGSLENGPFNYELENPNLILACISGAGNCQTVAKMGYFFLSAHYNPEDIVFQLKNTKYSDKDVGHIYIKAKGLNQEYFELDPGYQVISEFVFHETASQQIIDSFLLRERYIVQESEDLAKFKRSKPAFSLNTALLRAARISETKQEKSNEPYGVIEGVEGSINPEDFNPNDSNSEETQVPMDDESESSGEMSSGCPSANTAIPSLPNVKPNYGPSLVNKVFNVPMGSFLLFGLWFSFSFKDLIEQKDYDQPVLVTGGYEYVELDNSLAPAPAPAPGRACSGLSNGVQGHDSESLIAEYPVPEGMSKSFKSLIEAVLQLDGSTLERRDELQAMLDEFEGIDNPVLCWVRNLLHRDL